MIGSPRPPMKAKKGIQIIQSPSTKKIVNDNQDSAMGSSQSVTRSRGISISRENGINIDKIYDQKHFMPPKNTQPASTNNSSNTKKTLSAVRSLKLISLFAESNVDNPVQTSQNVPSLKQRKGVCELATKGQNQKKVESRCGSPIFKLQQMSLKTGQQTKKKEGTNKQKLIKF